MVSRFDIMSEHLQRTLAICATILIVGLILSAVSSGNLTKFNEDFRQKDFYSRIGNYPQAIRLNDKQFVIIKYPGDAIDVYQVDAKGQLSLVPQD